MSIFARKKYTIDVLMVVEMKNCAFTNDPNECVFDDDNYAWVGYSDCSRFKKHVYCKYYKSLMDLRNGGTGSVLETS